MLYHIDILYKFISMTNNITNNSLRCQKILDYSMKYMNKNTQTSCYGNDVYIILIMIMIILFIIIIDHIIDYNNIATEIKTLRKMYWLQQSMLDEITIEQRLGTKD